MLQEQLDAVKEQLLSEDNVDLRQSICCAFLEDAERGANMIIAFAREKGLRLDASTDDVVQAMNTLDDEDIDIEMTPEMLTNVAGGGKGRSVQETDGRLEKIDGRWQMVKTYGGMK